MVRASKRKGNTERNILKSQQRRVALELLGDGARTLDADAILEEAVRKERETGPSEYTQVQQARKEKRKKIRTRVPSVSCCS